MISRMNKRLVALVMACTVMFSQVPSVVFASTQIISVQSVYENDFSDDKLPDEVNGVITKDDISIKDGMLKFQSKFDGTDDWNSATCC